jgi:hypothetical protein
MADLGYVKTILRGVKDEQTRNVLDQIFTHLMGNIRLGVPEHQTRATNMQAYWQQSTSASDTSVFTIAHGLQSAPHWAIPVLDLSQPGSKAGGFEVARAADSKRVYLKAQAGSTNAPVTFLVES